MFDELYGNRELSPGLPEQDGRHLQHHRLYDRGDHVPRKQRGHQGLQPAMPTMKRLRDRAFLIIGIVVVVATAPDLATVRSQAPPPAPKPQPIASLDLPARSAPAPSVPAPSPPQCPTRVVIVSIDGLRPDVMTPEYMPRHVQLMEEGTTARHASTIPQSDTLPSHAAMLSGVGVAEHGLWWNSYQANRGYIRVPTVFSAARESGLSTAMIVGKKKLRHIAGPDTVDHFERPSYLCGGVASARLSTSPRSRPI